MNFKEHAVISRKTWHKEDVSKERRLNHAKLGLIDELGEIASCIKKNVGYGKEIDIVNLKEEIGDFVYFLQRYIEERNSGLNISNYYFNAQSFNFDATTILVDFSYSTSNMIVHGLDPVKLIELSSALRSLIDHFKLNISDILQTNINKLKARFGDDLEFSTDKATNRDLIKERKVLEK